MVGEPNITWYTMCSGNKYVETEKRKERKKEKRERGKGDVGSREVSH